MYDYKLHLVIRPHGLACGSSQEVNALNYILKPVKYYSLALTLDKVIRALSYDLNDVIMIKTEGNMVKLNCKNILYVDVVQHCVVFVSSF